MILLDDPNVEISDFLIIPETPARKGVRETEKRSFVVSSTPFRNLEESKLEKKAAEIKLKEERKTKREENKTKREEKAAGILKRRIEKEQNKTNKMTKHLKRKRINPSKPTTSISDVSTRIAIRKEAHIRNLFMEKNNETFDNRNNVSDLCFNCANFILASEDGVVCSVCTKIFHKRCVEYGICENFTCSKCS